MPVSNRGLAMGVFEAVLYAREVEVGLVIPVQMDNPRFLVEKGLLKSDLGVWDF